MKPVRVVVCGVAGRMGGSVLHAVRGEPGMEVAGATERPDSPQVGLDAGAVAGGALLGVSVSGSLEAALERAKIDLNRCTIYAPTNGTVISRNVDVGQTVAASLSAPTLFVIANDLSKMQIEAKVAEADVGSVAVGQPAEFTVDAYPGQTFRGRVTQIRNAPTIDQNVVTYDAIIEVTNPDLKLKPGMTADVSITVARRDNALRLPNAALRFRPVELSRAKAKDSTSAGTQASTRSRS